MQTFDQIVRKYGVKTAMQCVNTRNPNEPMPGTKRRTKLWARICPMCKEFDIIRGEQVQCRCSNRWTESRTKLKDFKPHFNIGLGCYLESKNDENNLIKAKGLCRAS